MAAARITLDQITKFYEEGGIRLKIFQNVCVEFPPGKIYALLGKSGSGKSTLLNLISGIDSPTSGRVLIGERSITHLSDYERTIFRRNHIGMIFQFFNLIPTLTILENVTLPQELNGYKKDETRDKAMDLLERVGLESRYQVSPDRLSGGEQQRVAIARALVNDPDLLLADEPTGNLDIETGKEVLNLMVELTKDAGKTMIVATHSADIVSLADEVYEIKNHQLSVLDRQTEWLLVSR